MRNDASVDYSFGEAPISKATQGVVEAVSACNDSSGPTENTLKQWQEQDDGLNRTRLVLRYRGDLAVPDGAISGYDEEPATRLLVRSSEIFKIKKEKKIDVSCTTVELNNHDHDII